ncbi:unnamed protein product [Ilex paraguariensis]|uniref:NADP-dependent oxidoreductase domain-containing protein n=1 Tax=Ilex paraguariensis TaxID=185542 RepID=A0ABC8TUW6_9AQUA
MVYAPITCNAYPLRRRHANTLPRFQPENVEHNKKLYEQVNAIATRKGCITSQLALAWLQHQGNDVSPIPSTTKTNLRLLKLKKFEEVKMATKVPRIKLGKQGLEVSAQGLGCMGMSAFYGPPKPDADMIKLIHHAVDSGITFLDTSDIYGPHTNEILVGKALKGGVREKVELATKFGIRFTDGNRDICGDPAYVRAACEASLKRLDIDCIDLYYQHRIDTRLPIEVTMGELKKLVEEGKIKYIGLSEASASTIRRAHAHHPITAVQLEWSLWSRDVEEEIIPTCRLGIYSANLFEEEVKRNPRI